MTGNVYLVLSISDNDNYFNTISICSSQNPKEADVLYSRTENTAPATKLIKVALNQTANQGLVDHKAHFWGALFTQIYIASTNSYYLNEYIR